MTDNGLQTQVVVVNPFLQKVIRLLILDVLTAFEKILLKGG